MLAGSQLAFRRKRARRTVGFGLKKSGIRDPVLGALQGSGAGEIRPPVPAIGICIKAGAGGDRQVRFSGN